MIIVLVSYYSVINKCAQNPNLLDSPPATKNSAQRAHANFTETHPSFAGAALVAGLQLPVATAVLGATWSVGRVLYAYGYTSSAGPKGRVVSVFSRLLLLLAPSRSPILFFFFFSG